MNLSRPQAFGLCLLALAGCTNRYYKQSADREVAGIMARKTPKVPNMESPFTIEGVPAADLAGLPVVKKAEERFGADASMELGASVISLEKALDLAVKHNRQYQTARESLFVDALSLTLARHRFTPIFSMGDSSQYAVRTTQARVVVDPLNGSPKSEAVQDTQLVEEHLVSNRGSAGVDMLTRAGGRISAAFTTDFLRFLSGDPRATTSSQLGATVVQPLWRGAGQKVAAENLTQAERSFLYRMREFVRFRKEFTVQIVTAYYNVLQSRDIVRNSWLGLQNFKRSAERERALAAEGQRTQASLGRLRQAELSTETAWINSIRSYRQGLDLFKIQLGLSADAKVVLEDKELETLAILHPEITAEDAIKIALATRLDLENARDQLADAVRKIPIEANSLRPQVDLVAGAGIQGQKSGGGVAMPDPNQYHWNAGLNVDLPFDRKAQRNSYRVALIAQDQAARALQEAEDRIKLQIRNDWRALDQARRNYEISRIAVELSERRVEEQELRAQLGRGSAQDLVDAQNDLISQKNLSTQALVGHTIARLQFWDDMGLLYIKENGRWVETAAATAKAQ